MHAHPSVQREGRRERGREVAASRSYERKESIMLQSVSLSVLEPPVANPRRKIDRKAIEGLAASIKQDGILHNLVVTPTGSGRKQRFQIVSGARRLEALKLLQERGELPTAWLRYRPKPDRQTALRPGPPRWCST